MNDKKQKAFIYTRRSQDRHDRQVLSIEGQLKELKKLVAERGYAPIWLASEERSAHKTGRPVFADMCERIEAGEARVIVTWAANRLARNALDGGRLIHFLHTGQLLKIVTPGKSYSTASMEDQFLLQIEFGMSKMYSDEISKNVKRGYRSKYERGEYPTHAPIGYVNRKVRQSKNIYPDPDRSHMVAETFKEAATGKYTLKEIWLYARDDLGLRTKKGHPVTRQTVQDMLRNIVYTGVFRHGGEYHQGSYTPLIDRELYDKVQLAMGWKRGGGSSRNSTAGRDYRYKGPFVCATCGHNMTAYTKPKKLRKTGEVVEYVYYVCTKKSKKVKCEEPQVNEASLEEEVKDHLKKVSITPDEAKLAVQLLRKHHKEHVNNRNTMLAVWKKDSDDARKSMDRLLDLRMSDEIDSNTFKQRKAKYEDVLVRTKSLIDDNDSRAGAWLELAEEFFSKATNCVETFERASDEEKRKILIEVGLNWKLGNKKALFTPREPYDLLVNRASYPNWRARPDSNRRSPP